MRAKIKVWGNEYLLDTVYWRGINGFAHVCFRDENEFFYVVHSLEISIHEVENIENMKGKTGEVDLIYADLEKRVFWEESQ